jgi:nicotinate-nucleotide pyrophosphorylase (carboxylating)
MTDEISQALIGMAIAEDLGGGDHSSLAVISEEASASAVLWIKEDCVLAGVDVALSVFNSIDSTLSIEVFKKDGNRCKSGDKAFVVSGATRSILQAERLVLNFMQRMSGIATNTRQYCDKIAHTKAVVLDTRKTTPGLRVFEKAAVAIGGGSNHRFGLYDMVMLKDNHIDYAGGIVAAIQKTTEYLWRNSLTLKVEVEARDLTEVAEILECEGVHRIMFDNFSIPDTMKAVEMVAGKLETESSGGIALDNIAEYAECGVDFISVGALTHHIRSVDLSLKAI